MASSAYQASENVIRAETNLLAPEAVHRREFQEKIDKHQESFPGGRLPSELYCFREYMGRVKLRLDEAECAKLRCAC